MNIDGINDKAQVDDRFIADENEERSLLEGLKFYFNIIWNRKIFIISITAAGAVLSLALAIATLVLPIDKNPLPNVYRAYTRVIIQEGNSGSNDNFSLMIDMLGMGGSGSQGMSNSSLAQMVYRSYPYADKVIDEFSFIDKYGIINNKKTLSRNIFYSNSTFALDDRSGELIISYTDTDRYLATEIVKFMLNELERWFHERGGDVSEVQIASIESKLYEVSTEINILEEKIKSMQLEYGVLSINELAIAQQSLVNNLNEQLMNLDLQISQQENSQSAYSPLEQGTVRELKAQRDDVAETLERLESGLPVGNKVYPPADELPNIALEFEQLQLLHEIQSGIYLSLTEQYELLKLSKGAGLSLTILEPAEVPENKFGPKRSQICLQMTAVSFVLGVVLTFLLYFYKRIREALTH